MPDVVFDQSSNFMEAVDVPDNVWIFERD